MAIPTRRLFRDAGIAIGVIGVLGAIFLGGNNNSTTTATANTVRIGETASITHAVPGCTDTDDYEKLVRFAQEHDQQAFGNFLFQKSMNGGCRTFESNAQVHVEDYSLLHNAYCVRAQGDTECYYVPRQWVQKDGQ